MSLTASASSAVSDSDADTTADLFTPVRVGRYLLRNRIAMAPMTRSRAGAGAVPTPLIALHYAQRASAGLLITEGSPISPRGVGYPHTPGIYTEAQVAGWRVVTDAVHARGGRIFVQLWHVGRVSHPSLQPDGGLPVSASAIAPAGDSRIRTADGTPAPFVAPRALELEEIPGVVREFAEAARRAIDAGFDGVELHGANGYLIDQFLRDGTNLRTDAYGGPIAHRARFLLEVAEATAAAIGGDRVGVRLSPRGPFNSMRDSDPLATFSYAAEALNPFGLAYLHVVEPKSGQDAENPNNLLLPGPRVTPSLRERFTGTMILNGGYTRELADATIAEGDGDLISFGMPFISNPDLVERFAARAPLAPPRRPTIYTGGAEGYTDYPIWDGVREA
jgi:N-ethylmaleimide reductase